MPALDLKETYMVIGDWVQLVYYPPFPFEEVFTLSLAFLWEKLGTTSCICACTVFLTIGYSRIPSPCHVMMVCYNFYFCSYIEVPHVMCTCQPAHWGDLQFCQKKKGKKRKLTILI